MDAVADARARREEFFMLKLSRAIFALVALFTVSAFAQEAGKAYTFEKKVPAAGSSVVQVESEVGKMKMSQKINGKEMAQPDQDESFKHQSTTTYLEFDGARPTKMKKTYDSFEQVAGGGPRSKDKKELAGKTFIFTVKDGKTAVTDGDGKEVARELADLASKDSLKKGVIDDLHNDEFSRPIVGKTLKIGETLEVPAEDLFNKDGSEQFPFAGSKVKYTFKEVKKVGDLEVGVFNVAALLEGEITPGVKMSLDTKGTVAVSLKYSLTVEGSIEGTIKGGGKIEQGEMVIEMAMDGVQSSSMKRAWTIK